MENELEEKQEGKNELSEFQRDIKKEENFSSFLMYIYR